MTTAHAAAISEIRGIIPEEILHGFAEFDGSATILVPNATEVFDLSKPYEGPQIIQWNSERLETLPTRISWELNATSTALRITDATTMDNRPDWNMVLVGTRTCEVQVGGHWFPDYEFFAMLLAAGKNDPRSVEQIVISLKQRGLDFRGQMPMYLQHLGADVDVFHNEIAPWFLAQGARDNTGEVRGSGGASKTVSSVRFNGGGLRVASFEVNTADRTRSKNGTGFISFLDASFTTLSAIVEADRVITASDKILNDPNADEQDKAAAQDRKTDACSYWTSGSQSSRRPFHNWGGTSRTVTPDGNSVRYYPTPVPCGRITLLDNTGNPHDLSVWQSARVLPGNTTAVDPGVAGQMERYATDLQAQFANAGVERAQVPSGDEGPF